MLMQMMSGGAMGGGISAAIARALGAGRRADADALVVHALAIAVGFGLLFMLAVVGGAPLIVALADLMPVILPLASLLRKSPPEP